MAEFKLDRFKYNWRGDWATGTDYKRDDVVRVNGFSYVCIISHTGSALFATDLNAILPDSNPPQPQPKWVVMTASKSFVGDWAPGTSYNVGDIVLFGGTVWDCTVAHTASQFQTDIAKWAVFTKHIKFDAQWEAGTEYGHGDIVKYGGNLWKCLTSHSAQGKLEDNQNDWQEYHVGQEYRNAWLPSTEYRINDIVKYGGSLFKCIESHTSNISELEDDKFSIFAFGTQFDGEWNSTTQYNIGDVVRYGGTSYYAITNNIESDPSRIVRGLSSGEDSTNDWLILSKGYQFVGEWSLSKEFKTGDITQRGGNVYVALRDVNINDGDESSLTYLDTEVWEKIIPGKDFKAPWGTGNYYSVGDIVYHLGTAYVCNYEHMSDGENYPGDNGNIYAYWDILIQAGDEGGLHDKGDLLTFGLSRTGAGDGSTLGDTRVQIGEKENVLSITEEQEIFWRTFTADSDVIYVAPYGINDAFPGRGRSAELPFRTVRYACEFIEDNFAPLSPTKVAVATGNYDEIGPIIVPAGCVVMGDELRSTTITATPAISEYAYNPVTDTGDYVHVKEYITHISSFIFDLISNNTVSNTAGNTLTPIRNIDPSNLEASNRIIALLDDFKNYIEFYIASEDNNPTLSGSNTLSVVDGMVEAANQLRINLEWIQAEIYAFLDLTYDNLDKVRLYDDINSLIRGVARDLQFSGNYGTLQAARRYSNAVNGSFLDDLFLLRDTTGLRNLTTKGLTGTLNPPGVFDLYQRPTGGACTSLDPGWGPADERTWIMQRSPYIQGVTNIGGACVGKKVDGSYHNGGNKSMVSNDFTQVLSDGIGAWVSNGARAELVSVFTYYCSVGYFAEDGGTIRATNGNNSYGSWGAIADGNDPAETPDTCSVWNRNNEALVASAFIGGSTDEVKLFEYSHAGQHYTNATASVVGAGASLNTQYDDFRDLAISQVRLINTTGSGSEGGSNYLVRQGFAQVTADASSTIKISNADPTQFLSEIAGMRIVIISGPATGQYGYIDSYSVISKEIGVKRESDDQDGWDHVTPGTALAAAFDSTTQYRIEPRVEVTSPSLSSNSYDITNARTFTDVAEGGTSVTYQNITIGLGTGAVEGIDQASAVYRILRTGKVYTPTLIEGGAGYAPGDVITISGDQLGGTSPDNDLIVTVLTVTDDSTNSILTASFSGIGREPRLVACADPNYIAYSDNAGQTWTETTHDVTGVNFHTVVAGDNKFIAVAGQSNQYVFSLTGESWTTRSFPGANNWMHATYGGGKFVVCTAAYANFLYSDDGLTWTETPHGGAVSAFAKVAYGQGKFVSVSNEDRAVTISSDGITWNRVNDKLPAEFATVNAIEFCGFAYGDNRFVGITESGKTCFSVDEGETWVLGGDVPQNGGSTLVYTDLKYGNGVWMATATDGVAGPTNLVATTQDGITWNQYNLDASQPWGTLAYTSNGNEPRFVILGNQATGNGTVQARTGAKAILRADVKQGKITQFKIWNPGGGYASAPTVTITDNQFISEAEPQVRLSNGVLAQPTFNNRGAGYRTNSTDITITGDGYADIIEQGNKLTLAGVDVVPGPGVQIRINGILDELTEVPDDLKLYNGVKATDLGDDGSGNGTRLVEFQISPNLENTDNLQHGTVVELRSKYSQCRITGHDFLDIGTGGFADTNYPGLYSDGNYFVSAPENEVYETNGGRVFYTSTDQDGNFRTGELFAVNQATGIVTISAQFFDLDGLSELSLGGVRLGGSGTSVQEFSTDPTMSADSNNVIPTQRAIATFLADRLSVGGEDLQTNLLQAGNVQLGGEDNKIDMNNDEILQFRRPVDFSGLQADGITPAGIGGTILSQMLLVRSDNDTVQ